MSYTITRCTVADGRDLAVNNMTAFWQGDPVWRMLWTPHKWTVDDVIRNCTLRMPRNLLRDRGTLRHQKAVDPATGGLLGYARWVLPESRAGLWTKAQVPDVDDVERREIERVAETAMWNLGSDMDELDVPVTAKKEELLAQEEFLSKLCCE